MHDVVLGCDPMLRCTVFVTHKANVSLVGSAPFALTSKIAVTLTMMNVHLAWHRYISLTDNEEKGAPAQVPDTSVEGYL